MALKSDWDPPDKCKHKKVKAEQKCRIKSRIKVLGTFKCKYKNIIVGIKAGPKSDRDTLIAKRSCEIKFDEGFPTVTLYNAAKAFNILSALPSVHLTMMGDEPFTKRQLKTIYSVPISLTDYKFYLSSCSHSQIP